jgi:hypothetical protein
MTMPKLALQLLCRGFGGFQNFHPHLHALATDGCFYKDSAFMVCRPPDTGEAEKI